MILEITPTSWLEDVRETRTVSIRLTLHEDAPQQGTETANDYSRSIEIPAAWCTEGFKLAAIDAAVDQQVVTGAWSATLDHNSIDDSSNCVELSLALPETFEATSFVDVNVVRPNKAWLLGRSGLRIPLPRWDRGADSEVTKDNPLIFFHVEKTAGTSIHAALEKLFPKDDVWPGRDDPLGSWARGLKTNGYSLVSSHLRHWVVADTFNSSIKFTVLRDPAERIYSLINYYRRQKNDHPDPAVQFALHAHLDAILDDHNTPLFPRIDNHYTRIFQPWAGPQVSAIAGALADASRSEALTDTAIRYLESFQHIGFTDDLQTTLSWLSTLLATDKLPVRRDNVAPGKGINTLWREGGCETKEDAFARIRSAGLCEFDDKVFQRFKSPG